MISTAQKSETILSHRELEDTAHDAVVHHIASPNGIH